MQVTELPAEGLKRQFKIVVPAGDLSAKVDERLAEMARTAQMPGFRAGRCRSAAQEAVRPGPVRRGRRASGQFQHRQGHRGSRAETRAAAACDLKTQLEEGKDVEFEVAIEVLPEIGKLDFSDVDSTPEGQRAGQGRRRGHRAHLQGEPRAEAGRSAAPGAEGRCDQARLRGLGRRQGIPRRRRAGLHAGARLGLVHSRLRGSAGRRRGRQGHRHQGDVPGRLRPPELAGKDACSRARSRRSTSSSTSRPTTNWPRRTTSRTSKRCARPWPSASARTTRGSRAR